MLSPIHMFDSTPITTGFELGTKLGTVNSPLTPLGQALKGTLDTYNASLAKQQEQANAMALQQNKGRIDMRLADRAHAQDYRTKYMEANMKKRSYNPIMMKPTDLGLPPEWSVGQHGAFIDSYRGVNTPTGLVFYPTRTPRTGSAMTAETEARMLQPGFDPNAYEDVNTGNIQSSFDQKAAALDAMFKKHGM